MRTGVRSVAAGTLALVSATAGSLAAQGSQRVARSAQPAVAVSAEAKLAPAQGLLRTLAGTRVFKPLFDSLRLEWTEVLDHSPVQGRGVVGFDEKSGRFFSSGVYSAGSTPEFLMGTMDDGEPLVTFTPLPFMPDVGRTPGQAFALSVIDADHVTVVALDRAWRAVFTRQP